MPSRLIANVLTRGALTMSGAQVVDGLRARFGEAGVQARLLLDTLPPEMQPRKPGFVLQVDGTNIAVAPEDFAMPFDELRPPETTRRDAAGLLTDHCAHAMLGVLDPVEGSVADLKAAMALMRAAAVLCEAPGASAVLWSSAQTLLPAEAFRTMVAQASAEPDGYPLGVLCRFGPFQGGTVDGKPLIGTVATGLARYVGRDLEFAPRARSLMDMMNSMGLIASMLLGGVKVEDGHTYGRSAKERIRIHLADAGEVLKQPVFLCEVEELDPAVGQRLQ